MEKRHYNYNAPHLTLARLTQQFAETRLPRLKEKFDNHSGFMAMVFRAFMSQRYRPQACPTFAAGMLPAPFPSFT